MPAAQSVPERSASSNPSPAPAYSEVDHQGSAPSRGATGAEGSPQEGTTITGHPEGAPGRTNQAY